MNTRERYQDFVTALIDKKLVTDADISKAHRLVATSHGIGFPSLLLDLGMLSESDLADEIALVSGRPRLSSDDYPNEFDLPGVSSRFLKTFSVAGLYDREEETGVAVIDPFDSYISEALTLALDKNVAIHVGVRSEIAKAVEQQFDFSLPSEDSDANHSDAQDIEHLRDIASEAPVIRFVNVLFQRAVEARASDIHIETSEKGLKLRLRVDGVLKAIESPPGGTAIGVVSRIKLLAKLNIAERRLPQDGKIRNQINGKEYDMRISTTPTIHGENVVIRLLDRTQVSLDFETLGFAGRSLERFLEVLSYPHGILLITGPTGSGKTTTLYTALTRLNQEASKIITVEDPVEYELKGINQIQVQPDIGLNFSDVLRAIVRQDPDIIMIGEMRDIETVNIAVQSALTGHMVLSTLHTNDAASGLVRLLDMGVDNFLLASTVNGILAQRLVRKLCDHCKESFTPSREWLDTLHFQDDNHERPRFYLAQGCEHCEGTGYSGRLAILELLVVTEQIKQHVMSGDSASTILATAVREGMATLFDDGIHKASLGLTTIEEVVRLTKGSL